MTCVVRTRSWCRSDKPPGRGDGERAAGRERGPEERGGARKGLRCRPGGVA